MSTHSKFTVSDVPAVYTYYMCDFLTNDLLAEVPMTDVTYGCAYKQSGTFTGSIPVIDVNAHLNLYNTTLPGKVALYVLRNGVCVWGGVIWSRTYNAMEKMLHISASEMTSYFHHRFLWKTWTHDYGTDTVVYASNGVADVAINADSYAYNPHSFAAGEWVRVLWSASPDVTIDPLVAAKYDDFYQILSDPAPGVNAGDGLYHFSINTKTTKNPDGVPESQTYPQVTIHVDTYDYVRNLLTSLNVDFNDMVFQNAFIQPAQQYMFDIASYVISGNIATITTSNASDNVYGALAQGQQVYIRNTGSSRIDSTKASFSGTRAVVDTKATNPSLAANQFTVHSYGSNISSTTTTKNTKTISTVAVDNSTGFSQVTFATSEAHGFSTGDIVTLVGTAATQNTAYISLDGLYVIQYSDANSFMIEPNVSPNLDSLDPTDITTIANAANLGTPIPTSSATVGAYMVYSSYGDFSGDPTNGVVNASNSGIVFSTTAPSGKRHYNTYTIGQELHNVGELLDSYSNSVNGFEYRIDCSYNKTTNKFTKTFVFMPMKPPSLVTYLAGLDGGALAVGDVAPPSAFGADKLVFEFPGNISSIELDESAEQAATRFWVQGDVNGSTGNLSSIPYAAASSVAYINDGWPILEQVENLSSITDPGLLMAHAQQYLTEASSPISNFIIETNGSQSPEVGTYKVGDWCSVITNDVFIQARLKNSIELRNDVFVRKIQSYQVVVPNNPAFPEKVKLTLITEPSVDRIGGSWDPDVSVPILSLYSPANG
jgi:hypothetical protein